MNDLISRQEAQHKINALIDEFETIMTDIRERHVDDSVCGLCEYDGAYIGESGNWCNECPGFDRDDCFKLKDQYREEWVGTIKNLPSAQPKHGKWIDIPYDPSHTKYMCSECGKTIYTNSDYIKEHKFCFSCGADMRCSENPNS